MNTLKKRMLGATVIAAASVGIVGASTAAAQPVTQQGLVNVNLTDVTVQVPIGIAANICDVNVGVLVGELRDDAANCEALGGADATVERDSSGGPVTQNGLVNVNADDVAVQVPIGIAANICDVNVAVLVDQFLDDSAGCLAEADPGAIVVESLPL